MKLQTAEIGRPRSIQLHERCINVRSVKNKVLFVADVMISRDIDILALTEKWLDSVIDDRVISALVPRGHGFHVVSRPGGKRGGGVAVLYKSGLTLKTTSTRGSYCHFEYVVSRCVSCVVLRHRSETISPTTFSSISGPLI